jgi:protease-4
MVLAISIGLFVVPTPASGDEGASSNKTALYDYWSENASLVSVPGASTSLAAGLFNPAAWAIRSKGGLYFAWSDQVGDEMLDSGISLERSDWTGIVSLRNLAFGMRSYRSEDSEDHSWHWEEYTIGLGAGMKADGWGISYSWSRGPECAATRKERLTIGSIDRGRYGSAGGAFIWEPDDGDYLVQMDLGLRPFGPRVTLFADAVWRKDQKFSEIRTGYGLECHPLRGLSIGAKALNTGELSFRVTLGLAPGLHPGASVQLDNDGEHVASTYILETGSSAPDLGLFDRIKSYPEIDLKGPMPYRRYKWFDKRRTLMGTLRQIDDCATDPRVTAVVVNLSGMRIGSEMVWELREQLAGLRAHGKKVIVYFDEAGMSGYMLASVADQIWMDPEGFLEIPGLAGGRTYCRDALEKLGIGFEEWRFFTYKSALEAFSRTSLSEADREQIGALVDDFYETIADAVTSARGITHAQWDRVINEKAVLVAREAQAAGLIDSVGTFEQAKEAAKKAGARTTPDLTAAVLGDLQGDRVWSPMEWGEPAHIALLYAIGPCSMDSGIKARLLSKKIKEARKDRRVKALVLRADSPGGSALASDLVAREIRETSKIKPVIVSQGGVAGSGGYWISMYGDTIVVSPVTITGSIGVIGGWFWDDGLGDKIGLTWDGVWRGDHADLGRGMRLPLLGMQIPERPLTTEERDRAEFLIRDCYQDFVGKVAEGRGMTVEEVDRVGQGRIWSGTRGKELGLVDEIGGLWYSLGLAKSAADIPESLPVQIVEGPSIGAFDLSFLKPKLAGILGLGSERSEALDPGESLAAWEAGGYPTAKLSPGDLLTEGERVFLEHLIRARGRPVHMMEPIQIHEGSQER